MSFLQQLPLMFTLYLCLENNLHTVEKLGPEMNIIIKDDPTSVFSSQDLNFVYRPNTNTSAFKK